MASTYTTNLGIEKIATGEQSGTWGATTNTNLDLIDQAVNGVVQITVAATGSTGSPNALTITNGSASDGRNKFIDFYSPTDLGGTVYYQLDPNDAEKIAFVRNSLGGGQTLVLFQGTYNASNDVEVPNGVDMLVKFDGTGASATVTNVFEKLQVNALSVNDGNITNVGDIALDSISADGTDINLSVSDNSATALTVKEGANTYLTIDTTDSAEKVLVSKTLDVGDNNITNVGNIALDSISADGTQIDIDITDNTASAFTISEGANNYIAITTTDGSELITVSKNSTFAGTTVADLGVVTTADINGGTIDGVTIGGASAGAITGTTITGTSFVSSGNMTFGDDDKAIFGAGNDLQIYHDGSNSYIDESAGVGNLIIKGANVQFQTPTSEIYLAFVNNGAVTAYYDNAAKLATTATGIDVTGTVTADGLIVGDGHTIGNGTGDNLEIVSSASENILIKSTGGILTLETAGSERVRIDSSGNVGIGTTTPSAPLEIQYATGNFSATYNDFSGVGLFISSDGTAGDGNLSGGIAFDSPDRSTSKHAAIVPVQTGSDGNQVGLSFWVHPSSTRQTDLSEAMRITSSGSVGIGTASPATKLHVASSTTSSILKISNSTTGSAIGDGLDLIIDGITGYVWNRENGPLLFATNNTERLRILANGNVGIGTSSPANMLHLSNTSEGTHDLAFNRNTTYGASTGLGGVSWYNQAGDTKLTRIESQTDGAATYTRLIFSTASSGTLTERLRIDSSGNLGLGVTPRNLFTGLAYKNIEINKSSFFGFDVTGSRPITGLKSNTYFDASANHLYIGNGFATQYQTDDGKHIWYTAPNNTSGAGAAVTFTQAMTLDASGNLGIGTTSPNRNLDVQGTGDTIVSIVSPAANQSSLFFGDTDSDAIGRLAYDNGDNSMRFTTNATERMRIDSSGNLLVGKTTTAFGTQGIRLEGSNGKIEITRDNNVPFALNRLTSDGDLIHFYKAGAIMGVIGVANGDNLYIASDDTTDVGLKFDGDANAIYACTATGAIRDNAVILGDPAVRFKDLYLSGSVYLGGTTSANALDDYEEGVWTPVLNRTTLGTVTYTLQTGYYVKIGRVVYVWGKVTWSNISSVGSGNNYISGLPFSAGTGQANGWANFGGSSGVATNPVLAGLFYNQTVYLRKSANILADGNIGEDYNNSGTFGFNGMYNIL
jgi:hypothetical protein